MRMIVDAVYPILLKVRPNEGLSAYRIVAFARGFDSQVGQHLFASHNSPEAATLLCYVLKCYHAVMRVRSGVH